MIGGNEPMLIPSIYVDLDDVVAETLTTFARLANDLYGKHIRFEDIFSFDLGRSFGLDEHELRRFMEIAHRREVLLEKVSPNQEALAVLREWVDCGADITIVTGRPVSTYEDTLDWLQRFEVPFHGLCFVRKYGRNDLGETRRRPLHLRRLAKAPFLFSVEDNLKTASYIALRTNVPVMLLDKPWNRTSDAPDNLIVRCAGWSEVRNYGFRYLKTNAPVAERYQPPSPRGAEAWN
jgi:uncharacterized HAD superfamily protein